MKIGKSEADIKVEKLKACRDIVHEIINFGVNEEQKIQIIYLLSLELENVNVMKSIADAIKDKKINIHEEIDNNSKSNKILMPT